MIKPLVILGTVNAYSSSSIIPYLIEIILDLILGIYSDFIKNGYKLEFVLRSEPYEIL